MQTAKAEWWEKPTGVPVPGGMYLLTVENGANSCQNDWICSSKEMAQSRLFHWVEDNWPSGDEDVPSWDDLDTQEAIDWYFGWNTDCVYTITLMTVDGGSKYSDW